MPTSFRAMPIIHSVRALPKSLSQVALLLLKFLTLDLAPCVSLFQHIERGFLPFAIAASAGTTEAFHQHHNTGNQQPPEQQHTQPHAAPAPTVAIHMSPHFALLYIPS